MSTSILSSACAEMGFMARPVNTVRKFYQDIQAIKCLFLSQKYITIFTKKKLN